MDYTGYGDAPVDDLSLRQAWANMLRGLSNKQSWQELGQGIQNTAQVLPNVAESLARGGVAQAVGTFGDLRDLKNSINSYLPQPVQNLQAGMETLANPMAKALVQRSPTTEQTLEAVPRATAPYEGYKQHEFIGQFVAPPATGLLADALKLGKGLPVGASIKAVDEVPIAPSVAKDELGFYSTLDEAANNLKQEKGTNAQFLAQLLKTPAVKQEEIAVRGLDKFLEKNPKLTKQELQDYLLHHKSKVNETVLDENHYASGTYEDYNIRHGEAIDDQDYINGVADDFSSEYKNDPNMVEDARVRLLEKDPEHYDGWEENPSIAERLQRDVEQELDNMAYDNASTMYWEDPIYRHIDDFDFEVLGNDSMGYSIKDPNGKWLDKSFNDISDAEAYLRDRHLENGDLRYEEQGPKYADYQLDGPSKNYREVLIQAPEKNMSRYTVGATRDGKYVILDSPTQSGKRLKNTKGEDLIFDDEEKALSFARQREKLTTQEPYTEGHYDEPNVLAHMRVNDRMIDGKKTLFIEEIQSDWHQQGRKKGYKPENEIKRKEELANIQKERENLLELKKQLEIDAEPYTSQGKDAPPEIVDKWSAVSNRINDLQSAQNKLSKAYPEGVPDAPYKKNWQELAMRRAIQMAADGGYERVAFTTGAQQVKRYENQLRQAVDEINFNRRDANTTSISASKGGRETFSGIVEDGKFISGPAKGKSVEEVLGKDIAKQIEGHEILKPKTITGKDLTVGGEGMKGFYDKILPDYVNKYGKKHGFKVGKTSLKSGRDTGNFNEFVDWAATQDTGIPMNRGELMTLWERYKNGENVVLVDRYMKSGADVSQDVHYFDLTPEAKSSLLEKGSPLFAAPALGLTGEESRREILEKLMGK